LRRLTGSDHLGFEFATDWPTYELDEKTRALLTYATKLTDSPGAIEDADIDSLRSAGWDEGGIWQATALIAFFNFSGRMEAAAGLPADRIPEHSSLKEGKTDAQGTVVLKRRAT
jgi:alkylhydroperoxidase family enzyme